MNSELLFFFLLVDRHIVKGSDDFGINVELTCDSQIS